MIDWKLCASYAKSERKVTEAIWLSTKQKINQFLINTNLKERLLKKSDNQLNKNQSNCHAYKSERKVIEEINQTIKKNQSNSHQYKSERKVKSIRSSYIQRHMQSIKRRINCITIHQITMQCFLMHRDEINLTRSWLSLYISEYIYM